MGKIHCYLTSSKHKIAWTFGIFVRIYFILSYKSMTSIIRLVNQMKTMVFLHHYHRNSTWLSLLWRLSRCIFQNILDEYDMVISIMHKLIKDNQYIAFQVSQKGDLWDIICGFNFWSLFQLGRCYSICNTIIVYVIPCYTGLCHTKIALPSITITCSFNSYWARWLQKKVLHLQYMNVMMSQINGYSAVALFPMKY